MPKKGSCSLLTSQPEESSEEREAMRSLPRFFPCFSSFFCSLFRSLSFFPSSISLFLSDSWPGVTSVVQVGLPSSGEQYIHRLGRTARAGKSGHGILILSPSEKFFLNKGEMKSLPLKEVSKDSFATLKNSQKYVNEALGKVSDETKGQCYAASLGYYKGSLKDLKWKPETLVSEMNMFAIQALLYSGGDGSIPPTMAKSESFAIMKAKRNEELGSVSRGSIERHLISFFLRFLLLLLSIPTILNDLFFLNSPLIAVGKMGLKGVHGLNIVRELPGKESSSNGRGGSANGGSGGRGGGNPRGRGSRGRSNTRGAPY